MLTDDEALAQFQSIQASKGGPVYSSAQLRGQAPAPSNLLNAARIARQTRGRYHHASNKVDSGFDLGTVMKTNIVRSVDLWPTIAAAMKDATRSQRAATVEVALVLSDALQFDSPVVDATATTIAERLGCAPAAVSLVLATLENAGIIRRVQGGSRKGNTKTIMFNPRYGYRGKSAAFKEALAMYESPVIAGTSFEPISGE
ncbi:MAG: hypothetical protein P4L98_05695 [Ancalomicrobiaceae bacterium]|nr:hypothetical protein [Ancalomicrobiaceae bacterium]